MKTEPTPQEREQACFRSISQAHLIAELQIRQDHVDRAHNELLVDSDPDDDAGMDPKRLPRGDDGQAGARSANPRRN